MAIVAIAFSNFVVRMDTKDVMLSGNIRYKQIIVTKDICKIFFHHTHTYTHTHTHTHTWRAYVYTSQPVA